MAKNGDKKGKKILVDLVSQDKDWRGVIDMELKCQSGWNREWGFMVDDKITEKPITKGDQINILEEKLKAMSDVKMSSVSKQTFKGGEIDFKLNSFNKKKTCDLMPQSRRPKYISKAHQHLTKAFGDDYQGKPYENYLGAK